MSEYEDEVYKMMRNHVMRSNTECIKKLVKQMEKLGKPIDFSYEDYLLIRGMVAMNDLETLEWLSKRYKNILINKDADLIGYAFVYGHHEIVKFLLDLGVSIDILIDKGYELDEINSYLIKN